MKQSDALAASQAIDERVNVAERARDVNGTIDPVYLLARAYTTKGGRFSVQILGVGSNWEASVADLQARTSKQ